MADFRFELNSKGVGELLRSREMQALLGEYAQRISGSAGKGSEQEVYVAQTRAVAEVSGPKKGNELLKALMGAQDT